MMISPPRELDLNQRRALGAGPAGLSREYLHSIPGQAAVRIDLAVFAIRANRAKRAHRGSGLSDV